VSIGNMSRHPAEKYLSEVPQDRHQARRLYRDPGSTYEAASAPTATLRSLSVQTLTEDVVCECGQYHCSSGVVSCRERRTKFTSPRLQVAISPGIPKSSQRRCEKARSLCRHLSSRYVSSASAISASEFGEKYVLCCGFSKVHGDRRGGRKRSIGR